MAGPVDKTAIDWSRLDKKKFFVVGAGLFSGLTTMLYPLSVIKTRQMALEGSQSGLRGAYLTARGVVAHDGVRGLYKGFGTVIGGMFPARMVYLSTLEMSKSVTNSLLHRFDLGDTAAVGAASFVGGAMASLSSQLIVVPIDVVAQRLMIMGGGPPPGGDPSARAAAAAEAAARHHTSGLALARSIVAAEGVRGLYRGFGASLAMFVPNSAIWWGSYGVWQQVLWHQVDRLRGHHWHSEGEILAVQGAAGILTGCTSAFLTNPLDVVKTRLQTAGAEGAAATAAAVAAAPAAQGAQAMAAAAAAGGGSGAAGAAAGVAAGAAARPTWRQVASHLLQTEGAAGFFRGVAPRMASSSIWGTTMVCSYEWLKRLCARPADDDAA
ncbi:solute carrier family 25 member 44 [Chlorella sorokiniana]|uniref:Solute carrier family 25 member 44 n=1 Tax=Chlorella sorokiniana TaxID=3076 RepID=A0A2P6TZI7_CHLSO|nr:solute carrier family 25 member 44 [Chlorella sorokiniana]|eukprot:PRW59482.1 solute carrier family 25 member 44 [Chlorella sorokiniana]